MRRQVSPPQSSLFTINRLLNNKDAYKSPFGQAANAGMQRRHTVEPQGRRQSEARNMSKGMVAIEEEKQKPETEQFAALLKQEKAKERDNTDAISCQLALKYKLMRSEVKSIIKEMQKVRLNEHGGVSQDEFDELMARIFDVPAVNKQLSQTAYNQIGFEKDIDLDRFLMWYVQNMFTSVAALTADKAMADANALAYKVAEKHNVSNFAIDKIKAKFDHYDLDKSGKIDFNEFSAMFCSILKAKSESDLNPERIKGFWKQADKNGDGGIDFEEFIDWYLRYFDPDNESDDWDMSGPIRKYYDSYNPAVQRRSSFQKLEARVQSLNNHEYF